MTSYSSNTASDSFISGGIYPTTSVSANRVGLLTATHPIAVAGAVYPTQTESLNFTIPVVANEGEGIGILYSTFKGLVKLRVFYYEVDSDLI